MRIGIYVIYAQNSHKRISASIRPSSGWRSNTRIQTYKSLSTDQPILIPQILIIIHF